MSTAGTEEVLDRNSIFYGIDCERCHGPSAEPVDLPPFLPRCENDQIYGNGQFFKQVKKIGCLCRLPFGNDRIKEISSFKFNIGDTFAIFFRHTLF